jgi:hypothetical protein
MSKVKRRAAPKKRAFCKVTLVHGPTGFSIYLNDTRIVGDKPWAGGHVVHDWRPSKADVRAALKGAP